MLDYYTEIDETATHREKDTRSIKRKCTFILMQNELLGILIYGTCCVRLIEPHFTAFRKKYK